MKRFFLILLCIMMICHGISDEEAFWGEEEFWDTEFEENELLMEEPDASFVPSFEEEPDMTLAEEENPNSIHAGGEETDFILVGGEDTFFAGEEDSDIFLVQEEEPETILASSQQDIVGELPGSLPVNPLVTFVSTYTDRTPFLRYTSISSEGKTADEVLQEYQQLYWEYGYDNSTDFFSSSDRLFNIAMTTNI